MREETKDLVTTSLNCKKSIHSEHSFLEKKSFYFPGILSEVSQYKCSKDCMIYHLEHPQPASSKPASSKPALQAQCIMRVLTSKN